MNDYYHSIDIMSHTHQLGQSIIDSMQSISPWLTSPSRTQLEEIHYGMVFLKAKVDRLEKMNRESYNYKNDAESFNRVVKFVNEQRNNFYSYPYNSLSQINLDYGSDYNTCFGNTKTVSLSDVAWPTKGEIKVPMSDEEIKKSFESITKSLSANNLNYKPYSFQDSINAMNTNIWGS
jgi:hypothetical protein